MGNTEYPDAYPVPHPGPLEPSGIGTFYPKHPYGEHEVIWIDGVNVAISGNSLTKSSGAVGFNAGAVSKQRLASGDGYVECTASETNTYRLFGLSKGNTGQDIAEIDFAIDMSGDIGGSIVIYENNANKGNFGAFVRGDKLRVAIVSGVVKYSKNGTVLYTSLVAPSYPILVDTSLNAVGDTITEVVVGGGNWE